MIGMGMKVRFAPCWVRQEKFNAGERKDANVTGKVIYINWEHRYFVAEYDCQGVKERECFKFSDIGQAVTVHG